MPFKENKTKMDNPNQLDVLIAKLDALDKALEQTKAYVTTLEASSERLGDISKDMNDLSKAMDAWTTIVNPGSFPRNK